MTVRRIAQMLIAISAAGGCCSGPKCDMPVDLEPFCCLVSGRDVVMKTPPYSCHECPYFDREDCRWYYPWPRRPCFCPPNCEDVLTDAATPNVETGGFPIIDGALAMRPVTVADIHMAEDTEAPSPPLPPEELPGDRLPDAELQ